MAYNETPTKGLTMFNASNFLTMNNSKFADYMEAHYDKHVDGRTGNITWIAKEES